MCTKVLKREVYINAPLKRVWQFFSLPQSLPYITPKYMNFTIIESPKVKDLFQGMEIEYKVTPLHVPMKWVSVIEKVETYKEFTDLQTVGPYELWRHKHVFRETPQGVHMTDEVHYILPFGFLGRILHRLIIKRRLDDIFDHRERVIKKIFSSHPYQQYAN